MLLEDVAVGGIGFDGSMTRSLDEGMAVDGLRYCSMDDGMRDNSADDGMGNSSVDHGMRDVLIADRTVKPLRKRKLARETRTRTRTRTRARNL